MATAPAFRFVRSFPPRNRVAPLLPTCLKYQSALVLTFPDSHPLRKKIDLLRKAYDRNYSRWPVPHIKLLYPFLTPDSDGNPTNKVVARVSEVVSRFSPFITHLVNLRKRHPQNNTSQDGAEVESGPDVAGRTPTFSIIPGQDDQLRTLQAALLREFRDEMIQGGPLMANGVKISDKDRDSFRIDWDPHMSLGKIPWVTTSDAAHDRFRRGIWGPGDTATPESLLEAGRFGVEWKGESTSDPTAPPANWQSQLRDSSEPELAWWVDRVHIMYRNGRDSPFESMKELELGTAK